MKLTKIFDFYLFRNLLFATAFIGLTLSAVIFLTQSLRFLELVIEAAASSSSFWVLTLLALPRFFEIILPLSLMAAVIFIYNRMTMDSELVAMRATGASPMDLARPALMLACFVTVFLWTVTMWVAPASVSRMQEMRQLIKAQFSTLLFREGVFNSVAPGLTVYVHKHMPDGALRGLMIHDSREKNRNSSTILAKKGIVVSSDTGNQVVVYDGSRQEFDPRSDTLHLLNFERYTIDLPESAAVHQRWREPSERTIFELFRPDMTNSRDREKLKEFKIEIHRRIASPLLAAVFTLMALNALLVGPVDRRGQGRRITLAISMAVLVEGLFLASFNLSSKSVAGLLFMYLLVIVPGGISFFFLSGASETFRRKLFYGRRRTA